MATRRDLANAIRVLAMDAVQKANSGHPGMPMGMADIAEVLWNNHLRHNPANPKWPNRDRFILSNGHGSMLHYALLHLSGYDLPIDEIKRFRQLHSKTPGHPEYGCTPGIETTTGPLGQGLANAVGMALSEKVLAAEFNRPGFAILDHYTYVTVGDGCLMEGISHEAGSLAGTLGLGKLIAIYDDNGISIDGKVEGWFTDDTPQRFRAYGWQVIADVDGHDSAAIDAALATAKADTLRPTLMCCKTIIGKGSPNKGGGHDCHGSALGKDEVVATREHLGWPHQAFEVPQEIYDGWDAREKGAKRESEWRLLLARYRQKFPESGAEFDRRLASELPVNWRTHVDAMIQKAREKAENIATRKASQNAIEGLAPILLELIGGSADLTGSNLTLWSGSRTVDKTGGGNTLYFGVREFGMSAMVNGMALYGGLIPYGATFLMFSEYARNALRMAALMKIRGIFVYTHDSIGLGEDGPTHQAVEQTATLRYIPNMDVWRPCDSVESLIAWTSAIERRDGPSCLLFSRQNLTFQSRNDDAVAAISRGGYVLLDAAEKKPDVVLIVTGSEVQLAVDASKALAKKNIVARVVSMPCTSVFDRQPESYRQNVLPRGIPRVAIEAGISDYWRKYVGLDGAVVGIDTFGESAPAGELFEHFGFTTENVIDAAQRALAAGINRRSARKQPAALR